MQLPLLSTITLLLSLSLATPIALPDADPLASEAGLVKVIFSSDCQSDGTAHTSRRESQVEHVTNFAVSALPESRAQALVASRETMRARNARVFPLLQGRGATSWTTWLRSWCLRKKNPVTFEVLLDFSCRH